MMAGIFLVFSLAMTAIALRLRFLAIGLLCLGLLLTLAMFWHHATDTLQIRL